MKTRLVWTVILLGIMGAAAACAGDTAESNRGGVEQPARTRYDGPDPVEGMGNVYGRIIWNQQGAAGLDVRLCQDFNTFSGCGEPEYRTVTLEDGTYLLADVEPGTYALSVRVFDSDDWLYVSGGILSSADFEVEANDTLVIDTQSIYKLDVVPTNPPNQTDVAAGPLTLTWDAYPEAAYYEVYLSPDKGDAILVNERVDVPEVTVGIYPVNCEYRWQIEAFNASGGKIAEMADDYYFAVTDEAASCHLQINRPVDGAEVDGAGIELDWEPNPLAASYKILMWNDSDPDRPNVLDFVGVPEAYYAFDQPLPPARYVWSVTAYDADNMKIGGSEIYDFTVRE